MSVFEKRVEAAARVLAFYDWTSWDGVPGSAKERYLHQARTTLAAADAVVTEEAHDEGMDAVDWDMVRDGVGDPQEAASISVRAALEAAALFRGGAK